MRSKMMIVRSANDIAMALAETIGGSEANFVKMMNAEAQRLRMNGTTFRNPNGLPADGQYSTARDLAVLARATWMQFPNTATISASRAIRAGNKVLRSYNTLLDHYRGANGMKTGFVCASGFDVVATATRWPDADRRRARRYLRGGARQTAAGLLRPRLQRRARRPDGPEPRQFPLPAVARAAGEPPRGDLRQGPGGEADTAVSALGPRFVGDGAGPRLHRGRRSRRRDGTAAAGRGSAGRWRGQHPAAAATPAISHRRLRAVRLIAQ